MTSKYERNAKLRWAEKDDARLELMRIKEEMKQKKEYMNDINHDMDEKVESINDLIKERMSK